MARQHEAKVRRLGDVLVEHGLITREQRRAALKKQHESGGRFGEILVQERILSRDQLNWALGNLLGIPYVQLDARAIEPELTGLVPLDLLRRCQAVPMVRLGEELTVAMADPTDARAIEEIRAAAGARLNVAMADAAAIQEALSAFAQRGAGGQLKPRQAAQRPLGELGFDEATQARLRRAAQARAGLIVVCGPRRSGCTTTLYALLAVAASPERRVVTLDARSSADYLGALGRLAEDPPDVLLAERLHQAEVWSALRPETLVSTLVLGEMRAGDVLGALGQLRDCGVKGALLASSLRLVVAQRLVQRRSPEGETLPGVQLLHQVLEPDQEVRDLIYDGAPVARLRDACVRAGMAPMNEGG